MNLSEYFPRIAYKKLSAVEANPRKSNQHEFNGVGELKAIFGESKKDFSAKFSYLAEKPEQPISAEVKMTWYDAREQHPTRTEHRLYYSAGIIEKYIQEGDLMVVAMRPDGGIYVFIAQKGSTYENQLALLFELPKDVGITVRAKDLTRSHKKIDFVRSFILGEIGIEDRQSDESYLDAMLRKFSSGFPKTTEFSDFARTTLPSQDIKNHSDEALINWMEREELLFRTYERYIVADQLKEGFSDVNVFIDLSLSIQNRRKVRVGYALENHLKKIFQELGISFSYREKTEHNSTPDFIFPGIKQYWDFSFPEDELFMLGSKSTCKDRWRQVLAEAASHQAETSYHA